MIGDTLAHYRIDAQLGAGGMGVVYRAFDTRLQRTAAIKVLAGSPSPDGAAALLREARSASALNHPNVCTIYEIGEAPGCGYIAMEHVDGRPLSDMVPAGGLPVDGVVHYGTQIADALAHAHARGVIHRDLKAANVMVTDDRRVKVLDFGLALQVAGRVVAATTDPTAPLSPAGSVAGTLSYMAPELLRGGEATVHADVWALGVLLYEMATGKLPFAGATAFELSASILYEPVGTFPPGVPVTLRAIVLRCLAKEPLQRYQGAGEVRAALQTLYSGLVPVVPPARLPASVNGARRSVLVLPFANLTPDAQGDYFSDGLTDEVIADLSNVRALRVISRTSSMLLKASTRPIRELAADVNVEYVLEGTVRRSGPGLRVTAQLVDAATDSPVWAHKYSGKMEDVFAIQETLSRSIVEALKLKLSAEEEQKMAERPIGDVEAYDLYLRARQQMFRFSQEGLDRAMEHLRDGMQVAGDNVLLLSAMGHVHWQYVNAGLTTDLTHLDQAEDCAQRILAQDPESPHGHRLLGLLSYHRADPQTAVQRLKRAAAGDPNDVDALAWLAVIYTIVGKASAAKPLVRKVLDLDPLTPLYQALPTAVAISEGDFAAAAEPLARSYDAYADNPGVRFFYGVALALGGTIQRACDVFDDLNRDAADSPYARLGMFYRAALTGQREAALAAVNDDLKLAFRSDPQSSLFMAECYALVGESDHALEWLAWAIGRGVINYPLLATLDPFLAGVRGEPRFERLMEEVRPRWEAFEV